MEIPLVILIGISLAMDCFAVSLAASAACPSRRIRIALAFGISFGVFQSGMMILGWSLGTAIVALVSGVARWIAFGILSLIGGKMIWEGVWEREAGWNADCLSPATILILATATSIDSLGVGLSLGFVDSAIYLITFVVGAVAFIFSCLGAVLGGALAEKFGKKFEVLGGIILIGIGVWILLGHLAAP